MPEDVRPRKSVPETPPPEESQVVRTHDPCRRSAHPRAPARPDPGGRAGENGPRPVRAGAVAGHPACTGTSSVLRPALTNRASTAVSSAMQVLTRKARFMPSMKAFLTDRKSTRLNSSHVKISYAVFCLKKKKKKY